jgi:hypothetical protein
MVRDITIGETFDVKFTTISSTGAPITLAGSPVISAYPGNSVTQLTAGITLTVDFDGVTGLHNVRIVASVGNGYADATDYALVITTGTVDGVSVVGYVADHFTIGRSAAHTRLGAPAGASVSADVAAVKVDTAAILVDTGTTLDGRIPAALVGGRIDSSVGAMAAHVMTAAAAAADLTTELQSGLATAAALDTIDNFLDTEVAAILEDTGTTIDDLVDDLEGRLTAALATVLQAHALGVGRGVMDAGSTTTALVFELVNGAAASAVNDFYNGRHIIFTSGALTLQATSITDYVGATKTATVPALTGAPADDVTFIIV